MVGSGPADQWWRHDGGALRYAAESRFGEDSLPAGLALGPVSGVVTSDSGDVYVLQRGTRADPVLVFDAAGHFVRAWGRGMLPLPHSIRIDKDQCLWVTDAASHRVLKFSAEGRCLLALGTTDRAGGDDRSFDGPTDVAFSPKGEVYVADGYGNARVVKFAPNGRFIGEWGHPGRASGEFDTPHAIGVDAAGMVYVGDRGNGRIQVFDPEGRYLTEWRHVGAAQGIFIDAEGMWLMTHRDVAEIVAFDSLAGRIAQLDLATGDLRGWMASPGHSIHRTTAGDIFVGSLTGNVFRWTPGWPAAP